MSDIIVEVDSTDLTVSVDDINIDVIVTVGVEAFVPSDTRFSLNGAGGNSYLIYNSSTQRVEIWVLGVLQGSWGTGSGGNPF